MNTYFDTLEETEEDLSLLSWFMAMRSLEKACDAALQKDLPAAEGLIRLARSILNDASPAVAALATRSSELPSRLGLQVASELPGACGARRLNAGRLLDELCAELWTGPLKSAGRDPAARALLYRLLAQRSVNAVAAGCSVVAEASFRESPGRALIEASAGGAPFIGIWMSGSQEGVCPDGWRRVGELEDRDVPGCANDLLHAISSQMRARPSLVHSSLI
jgi:hypothetical protein